MKRRLLNWSRRSFVARDPDLEKLLLNNKRWVDEKNKSDPDFFEKISKGQSP